MLNRIAEWFGHSAVRVCALAALALIMSWNPGRPSVVRLHGHVPDAIKNAKLQPPLEGETGSEPVTLTVVLKRTDESGFQRYLKDVYNPQSPRYRRFLSQEDMTSQFGPSNQAYDNVLQYFERNGFKIAQRSPNRMTVTVTGTRAQAERALSTHIRDFEAHGRRFFANDVAPAIPVSLAADIHAIVGLSDLAVPKSAQLAEALVNALLTQIWELNALTLAGADAALIQAQIAAIDATLATANEAFWVEASIGLELPALEILGAARPSHPEKQRPRTASAGAGQKVGILAFSSINLQDVADWLTLTQRPASLLNQVSQVAVNGGAPLGPDETDVLLTVETLLTIAPGAQVVIYHAPKGLGAPGTSYQTLFNAMIGDHVNIISNSSNYCEDQTTAADVQTIDSILATAAGSGISVFNATGDAGSSCSDGSANTVAVPADSPNATAVGATSPTFGPGFTYGSEAWLDGSGRVPPTGQSGFGVSRFFSRPSYQAGVNASPMRSIPDVTAPGDPQTGLSVCQADAGGCPTSQTFGGTSLSTPVWAAFAALLNQSFGHPLGLLNPSLYPLAGSNGFHSAASMGSDSAHVGLGSPNGDLLALELANQSPGTPSPSNSTVQATSPNTFTPFVGTTPADGSSAAAIVVRLQDAAGNEVFGKTVSLSASAGSNAVITPPSAVSNTANGAVIFNVTDTTVEVVTFTASDQSDNVTLTQTATVSFVGPVPTAAGIAANPTSVPDDGVSSTTITVTLQGQGGVPSPGRRITLSQGAGNSIINGPNPSLTDSNGKIQFTATDSVGETVTYTATDVTDGLVVPGSAQVTFTGQNTASCGGVASPATGFAITSFVTGFVSNSCVGPVGIAFDNSGNVYISGLADGFISKFGLSGGVAGPTTRLNTNSLGANCPAGLAFSKDLQHLYLAMQCNSTVVEISPTNGAILRTLGSVGYATGLATDPLSGDLFASDVLGSIYRISNPQSTNPTVTVYSSQSSVDGITFAPDGTLFAKGPSGEILEIDGTNSATPGGSTVVTTLPVPDGLAVAVSSTTPPTPQFLFVNRNDGNITKVDLTEDPPAISPVASGGSRGDLIAVGPDGCFYATQSDRVLKVTNADGSCPFSPTSPFPALLISPSNVTPNPAQGTSVTFTATFNNLSVPANTPVTFNVLGPNFRSFLAKTNANGQATFTYTGVFTGTDAVVATATVGANSLMSSIAYAVWTGGPHTTWCDLDLSSKTGAIGGSSNLSGSLFDISVIPPVPVSGASVTLAVGGQSCSSGTDATGKASCSLVLNSPGTLALTGTFMGSGGSPQLLPTQCSSSFTAVGLGNGTSIPVAIAGKNRNVPTGLYASLDGGQSYDLNENRLTYAWTVVSKPASSVLNTAALGNASTPQPFFLPDVDGVYTLQLIVNNGSVNSAPSAVQIHSFTGSIPPNANAGPSANARRAAAMLLNGTASNDPSQSGLALTYAWTVQSAPGGSALMGAHVGGNTPTPSFAPDADGAFVIALQVSDTAGVSGDTVTITAFDPIPAANVPPNAVAGPNRRIVLNTPITVDGSASNDPDNGPQPLTYQWEFVSGSLANTVLLNAAGAQVAFAPVAPGFYALRLDVSDGEATSFNETTVMAAMHCDANADGLINQADFDLMTALIGSAAQPNDPLDVNGDGLITSADIQLCKGQTAPPGSPSLYVTPAFLVFQYTIGGPLPAAQPLTISGTLNTPFTVPNPSFSWITLTPQASTTPANISVGINPAGLAPGPYLGQLIPVANGFTSPAPVRIELTVLEPAQFIITPSTLTFNYQSGGPAPAPQTVELQASGQNANFSATVSGASWLSVNPSGAMTPKPLVITATPSPNMAPGTYTAIVTFASATAPSQSMTVTLIVTPTPPTVTASAIVNAASDLGGAVAPGEIIFVGGNGFAVGGTNLTPPAGPIPNELGSTQVFFDNTAAPLLLVQPGLLKAIVPYEVAGQTSTSMRVVYDGASSPAVTLPVAVTNPGIFTATTTGIGQVVAANADGSLNTSANPAARGSVVTFYVTGEGQTIPPGVDGAIAPPVSTTAGGKNPPVPVQKVSVTIGGQPVVVTYAGGAPGFPAGLMQVNVVIPNSAPTGVPDAVVITIGPNQSQPGATIAVN